MTKTIAQEGYEGFIFNNMPIYLEMDGARIGDTLVDTKFTIIGEEREKYIGVFKDNKPFHGYFRMGIDREFFWVDYYEAGEPKYHYSFDIYASLQEDEELDFEELDFEELDFEEADSEELDFEETDIEDYEMESKIILDVKSTYKDGKIYEGVSMEWKEYGILTKHFKEGLLTGATMDVFAMHYYNRLSIKQEASNLIITNIQDSVSHIQISFSPDDNSMIANFIINEDVLITVKYGYWDIQNLDPNRFNRLSKVNENYRFSSFSKTYDFNASDVDVKVNTSLLEDIEFKGNITQSNAVSDILDLFDAKKEFPEVEPFMIGQVETNGSGEIMEGNYWEGEEESKGVARSIEKGKVVKEKKMSLKAFQEWLY